MSETAIQGTTQAVVMGAQRPTLPAFKSARNLTGQSNWWDKVGVVGGYYTNLDPDDGLIAQPNNSGARAATYIDTGFANVRHTITWSGIEGAQAGPLVCINENEADFGYTLYFETILGQQVWVLWALGRQPDDIRVVQTVTPTFAHVDGVPMDITMEVRGNRLDCYADPGTGEEHILTNTIPSGLLGSTIHGVSIDVNNYPSRPANLQCVVYPAVTVGIK